MTCLNKKQAVVARPSGETEYSGMAMEFASFYGLKTLLQDLGIVGNGPTKLYCDRNATINMAHNPSSMTEQNTLRLTNTLSRKNLMA